MNNKSRFSSILVLSFVVVIVTATVAMGLAFGKFEIPEFIRVIFGKQDESSSELIVEIPDISTQTGGETLSYFDYSEEDILNSLIEKESYNRRIRIISSYGEKRDLDEYLLSVDNGKFIITGQTDTMIYDGTKLYIKNELSEETVTAVTDVCSELGITSLDELKLLISENSHKLSYGSNERTLKATIYDSYGQINSEYELSLETGIIITEYHYKNGEIYRAVVTTSVSDYDGEEISLTKG